MDPHKPERSPMNFDDYHDHYAILGQLDALSDQLTAAAAEMAEEAQRIRTATEVRTLENWWAGS
jgi:hypothetical protein